MKLSPQEFDSTCGGTSPPLFHEAAGLDLTDLTTSKQAVTYPADLMAVWSQASAACKARGGPLVLMAIVLQTGGRYNYLEQLIMGGA